ncbi:MAG: ATP-binding protein, partial [Verrucomicrobiota bacterium]
SGASLELHRPLLNLHRSDLRAWLQARKLRWREDASNAEATTVRNRLRLEALPLLSSIAGRDASVMLARAATAAGELQEILAWALDQAQVLDPQGRLHLPAMRLLPPPLQRAAMARFLQDHAVPEIGRDLVERAMCLLDVTSPAAVNLPGGGRLRRCQARLFVEPSAAD